MTTTNAADDARPVSTDRASGAGQPPTDGIPLLRLRGINKSFGSVHALVGANLDVPAGQVTALVGDNGAGKSTLSKAISGISGADSGEIDWKGERVEIKHPKDATALGIATVYQDLALCDNLDIVQNIFLGREASKRGLLDEAAMEHAAKRALAELSVVTVRSIRQLVGSLSGGQRQAVAVARAVMDRADLVIMDEPTAALGVSQTRLVIDLIGQLASTGVAVIVISHNLLDVFAVADRIAVLYLGHIVAEGPASEFDAQVTVELITTGASANYHPASSTPAAT